jgi:hypothetical protein
MEPEGSLLCSQEPSTGPYSEPDQSNPYHPIPNQKTQRFGNWICFRRQVRGEDTYSVGPLE